MVVIKKRTIAVYELKYTKNIEQQDIKQNCPNCGAPTKTSTRGKCSYCNTIIAEEYSGWRVAEYKVAAETKVDKI